jgi:hypothetical protein
MSRNPVKLAKNYSCSQYDIAGKYKVDIGLSRWVQICQGRWMAGKGNQYIWQDESEQPSEDIRNPPIHIRSIFFGKALMAVSSRAPGRLGRLSD